MRVWLFAGGEYPCEARDGLQPATADVIVCVDAGLVHAANLGLHPDLLIGDFDSVGAEFLDDERYTGIERHEFPVNKNASDLQLALELVAAHLRGEARIAAFEARGLVRSAEVLVVGVSGGRTDHMLFNWQLPALQDWPFELGFVDATVEAFVVTPEHTFRRELATGRTVSLLPLFQAEGVSTGGLLWPLDEQRLRAGDTLGLSNRVACPQRVPDRACSGPEETSLGSDREHAGIADLAAVQQAGQETGQEENVVVSVQVRAGRLLVMLVAGDPARNLDGRQDHDH